MLNSSVLKEGVDGRVPMFIGLILGLVSVCHHANYFSCRGWMGGSPCRKK